VIGPSLARLSALPSMPRWMQNGLVTLAFLGLWQLVVSVGLQDEFWVSSPQLIVERLGDWQEGGELWDNLLPTLRVALTGFLLAAVAAMVVAVALASSRWLDEVLGWYLDVIYALPKPALVPMFLFALGLGDSPKYVLVVLIVFFVFYYNLRAGLGEPRANLRNALGILGARRRDVVLYLELPTLVPYLVASARIGAPLALVGTVFAEFFTATPGMGNLIERASTTIDATGLLAGVAVLTVIGALVDNMLRRLDLRIGRWRA